MNTCNWFFSPMISSRTLSPQMIYLSCCDCELMCEKKQGAFYRKENRDFFTHCIRYCITNKKTKKKTMQPRRKSSSSSSVSSPLVMKQRRPVAIKPLLVLLLPPALTAAAAAAPLSPGWQLLLPALQLRSLEQSSLLITEAATARCPSHLTPPSPASPLSTQPESIHPSKSTCADAALRVPGSHSENDCVHQHYTALHSPIQPYHPGEWEWHFSTAAPRRAKEEGLKGFIWLLPRSALMPEALRLVTKWRKA